MDLITENINLNSMYNAIFWFTVVVVGLKIFEIYLVKILRNWAQKTNTQADDIIIEILESISWPMYITLGTYAGSRNLNLNNFQNNVITTLTYIITFIYIANGLEKLARWGLEVIIKKSKRKGLNDPMIKRIFGWAMKGVIYGGAIIFVLQNLGFQITGLLGGLGIGGVAIAFALQNILGDIFSYFTIYFDRPFEIGDFIIVGEDMGTVEKIGLKSTRVRTLQGEELVMSNQELTSARLHNFKKLQRRRVVFNLGLTYDTSTQKLKKGLQIVKNIIAKHRLTEVDRVHFTSFGDFALNIEAVYYLDSADYNVHMDTQQAINLEIKDEFAKLGVEMAFPTQTIQVQK